MGHYIEWNGGYGKRREGEPWPGRREGGRERGRKGRSEGGRKGEKGRKVDQEITWTWLQ